MAHRKERPDPNKSLVGFIVGDVSYAVPIASVREIVNPGPLTSLPHLPAAVAGVADHRDEVIVVVDLRARFGLGPATDQSRTKWVLLAVSSRTVGLIVDQVTEVFGTGGEQVRPAPTLGSGEDVRGITGVIAHGGQLTFVLDVGRLEALTNQIPEEVLALSAGG
ncbi:MAG TPA: chemotaxis protein CheW [Polyangiaceae bacterium]|nr:chemotaxis protein CheW [Polyangiaceae bacterium]